jgi:hypothetical protein
VKSSFKKAAYIHANSHLTQITDRSQGDQIGRVFAILGHFYFVHFFENITTPKN